MKKLIEREDKKQIDRGRLDGLNRGEIETATLSECLAVDFAVLMRVTLPELGDKSISIIQQHSKTGILKRMKLTSQLIYERMDEAFLYRMLNHQSDTVRGWACFWIGISKNMTLAERLNAIRPLADDHHFGVREWAWMAVRPHIAIELENSIFHLADWTKSPSERLRRFASESIRPRGVWCAHLVVLKKNPEIALPVLEPLCADSARYVQDSVGNWLNDAGKDQPAWVRNICQRWMEGSAQDPNTKRIVSRALRLLK